MPPSDKMIAGLIRQYRAENHITQAETAERIGISRNYLSQIERGVSSNMTLDVYRKICRVIDMPVYDLTRELEILERQLHDVAVAARRLPPEIAHAMTSVHFVGSDELSPETKTALGNMVQAAVEAIKRGELGKKHG